MTDGQVKIKFPLADDPLGIEAEWMWATPVNGGYVLDNSPFHVYGVSFKDVVSARLTGDRLAEFDQIVSKGGHRTLRVRLDSTKSHTDFLEVWPPLQNLGCSFEGSQIERPLYAIDVPPSADVSAAIDYLYAQEEAGHLEYEEADVYA